MLFAIYTQFLTKVCYIHVYKIYDWIEKVYARYCLMRNNLQIFVELGVLTNCKKKKIAVLIAKQTLLKIRQSLLYLVWTFLNNQV